MRYLSVPGLTAPLEPPYHEKMYRGQAMIPRRARARERVPGSPCGFRLIIRMSRSSLMSRPRAFVGSWKGPSGLGPQRLGDALEDALEHPLDFPALRQMMVPGDRVAIALDGSLTGVEPLLFALKKSFDEAGVSTQDVTVVVTPASHPELVQDLPEGMTLVFHDPSNREGLAYLAATKDGRRIYLNRHLTDADVVIPVARAGFDPVVGYRGPWSVLFPGLSQEATRVSYRERLAEDPPPRLTPPCRLEEPFEVSWLLGTQFYLALVPGVPSPARIIAGLAESVRDQAIRAVNDSWIFQVPDRAECVIAGIGAPGCPQDRPSRAGQWTGHSVSPGPPGRQDHCSLAPAERLDPRSSGCKTRRGRLQGVFPGRCEATSPTPIRSPDACWPRFSPGPTSTC